ncbi:MAG: PAS domain-containing protein, partial [Candidatus Omnitrophica bacterium]|nr:PAS domain-containing protein [Candidatus Omnitrophota bacterium]
MEDGPKQEILEELESLRQRNAELEITSKQCSWAESRLQKEKERLQRYLDLAGEIVVALDKKGKIILINKRGSQILGYEQNEIIGKNWVENFIPKRIRSQVRNTLTQVLSGKLEGSEYYENPVLTKNKSERLIRWHNACLQDERGIITLSTGEDITERKLTEWRLKEINKCFLSFGQDATLNINNVVKVCGKLLGADCALYNR